MSMPRTVYRLLSLPLALLLALLPVGCQTQVQPALRDYEARLAELREQIPAVVASAQQAAESTLKHPGSLLTVPYWEQQGFSSELQDRAGGLAHLTHSGFKNRTAPTPFDIVLLSVRSWEKQKDLIRQRVKEYQARGWTVTVIGSAAGKPPDLGADFFVDNGAPSGGAEHGRINVLANVTLGWMWCCEYAAAMSRHGKFPAVLQSANLPGALEYDWSVQNPEGRHTVVDCPTAIPAGQLANRYLERVDRLVRDLESPRTQGELAKAAAIIARRLAAGGRVGVTANGHVIVSEVRVENRSPWYGFRITYTQESAVEDHLDPDDLLVYFAYVGLDSFQDNYAKRIARAQVDLITSYVSDPDQSTPPPPTLAHIEQSWTLPDAEVPIPEFPHAMAPVSGLNRVLLYRMLDDEVAVRLADLPRRPVPPPLHRYPLAFADESADRLYRRNVVVLGPLPACQWGMVDATGQPVVPMRYEELTRTGEGLIPVCQDNKWGYLDAEGNEVVAPTYDYASPFVGGSARVSRGDRRALMGPDGKLMVPLTYNRIAEPYWGQGPFLFTCLSNRWGVIDRQGKVLIEPQYDRLRYFSDTLVGIQRAGQWGLITPTGEEVVAPRYDTLGAWRDRGALVTVGGRVGLIDGEGQPLVPPRYDRIDWIGGVTNDVVVAKLGKWWGCFTKVGEEILPPQYDEMSWFWGGPAHVCRGQKWGLVSVEGKEIVTPQYDGMKWNVDGMIAVQRGEKWGYIDLTGRLVIPIEYDDAANVQHGRAIVCRDGNWGALDKNGNGMIPFEYEYLGDAGDGFLKFVKDGKWGFLDQDGQEIVPAKYTYVLGFAGGCAAVAAGGEWSQTFGRGPLPVGVKWGLVDATGRELIPPQYDRLVPFRTNLIAVARYTEAMPAQP